MTIESLTLTRKLLLITELSTSKMAKKIKFIDRSWVDAGLDDPRSMYWGYWYGSTIDTGHETLAFIPRSVSVVNKQFKKKNLWSTQTLKRMPKKIN
jgi:hypothetical protein